MSCQEQVVAATLLDHTAAPVSHFKNQVMHDKKNTTAKTLIQAQ